MRVSLEETNRIAYCLLHTKLYFFPYAQFPLINPKQDVQPHSHQYSNRSAIITQNKGAILKKVWKMIRKSSWIDTRFISWNSDASNNQTGFFCPPTCITLPVTFSYYISWWNCKMARGVIEQETLEYWRGNDFRDDNWYKDAFCISETNMVIIRATRVVYFSIKMVVKYTTWLEMTRARSDNSFLLRTHDPRNLWPRYKRWCCLRRENHATMQ